MEFGFCAWILEKYSHCVHLHLPLCPTRPDPEFARTDDLSRDRGKVVETVEPERRMYRREYGFILRDRDPDPGIRGWNDLSFDL